jgi:hypothetical protein
MNYDKDTIPICQECDHSDTAATKNCERCGNTYCVHFASTVDARYCGNCMVDFKVVETIEVKTTIYENAEGHEIIRRRQIAKSLKLEGTDWLFANMQISLLTDEELLAAIEYHRNIAGIMLLEREERKTEQLNKLSKVKLNLKQPATINASKAPKSSKTEAQKNQATIAKALAGLTPEQLAQVIAGLMKQNG